MAFRQDTFGELKVPLAWTAGVALVVCVVIAIGLMLSDRRGTVENTAHAATQQAVDTVVTPVGDVLSAPGRWISGGFSFLGSYWDAAGENRRLKVKLQEAQRFQDRSLILSMENARLRTILGVRTEPALPMVTARVVLDARGPFRRAQLANAGSDRGVAVGYPVISERGVIGRVIGVSGNASRILLLKDVSSRTPVMIARSSLWVRYPVCRSIVAWAIDPAISCRQSRQSNEMDSVNSATAAAGPPANRPLRETGVVFFMRFTRLECATKPRGSHC